MLAGGVAVIAELAWHAKELYVRREPALTAASTRVPGQASAPKQDLLSAKSETRARAWSGGEALARRSRPRRGKASDLGRRELVAAFVDQESSQAGGRDDPLSGEAAASPYAAGVAPVVTAPRGCGSPSVTCRDPLPHCERAPQGLGRLGLMSTVSDRPLDGAAELEATEEVTDAVGSARSRS
jgi:hypothetical protein